MNMTRNPRERECGTVRATWGNNQFAYWSSSEGGLGTRIHIQWGHRRNSTLESAPKFSSSMEA